jgi:Amt family ammonium transporter
MSLNGALAGLVAITAGCDVVTTTGAFFIGLIAGLALVVSVEFFDNVAKIDDPVGAISVHGVCGALGTILTGLFAEESGLFYGGGFHFLGVQLLGVVSVIAWVAVTMTIIFKVIDKLIGLRVSPEVELDGLDYHEHGLASAYAGFSITDMSTNMEVNENTDLGEDNYEAASERQKEAAIPVTRTEFVGNPTGMYKISIIAKHSRYELLKNELNKIGITGMTVTQVMGCGIQKGAGDRYRGVEMDLNVLPKMKVDIIIGNVPLDLVIDTAKKALYTGHIGDGKIFVYDVQKVVKIRTGEEDFEALKDVE